MITIRIAIENETSASFLVLQYVNYLEDHEIPFEIINEGPHGVIDRWIRKLVLQNINANIEMTLRHCPFVILERDDDRSILWHKAAPSLDELIANLSTQGVLAQPRPSRR